MNPAFSEYREPFLAGFFENPDRSRFYRYANANRRFWEEVSLPDYTGGMLYPEGWKFGKGEYAVYPNYSFTYEMREDLLAAHIPDEAARETVHRELCKIHYPPTPHAVCVHIIGAKGDGIHDPADPGNIFMVQQLTDLFRSENGSRRFRTLQ